MEMNLFLTYISRLIFKLLNKIPRGDFKVNCQFLSLLRADWDVVILAKMYLIVHGNTLCFGRGTITLLPRGGDAEAWKPGLTWILVF